MATAQELIAGARKAEAAGDMAAAARLKEAARMALREAQEGQDGPLAHSYDSETLDTVADLGRGVGQGFKTAGNWVQKTGIRLGDATGLIDDADASDMLDSVNQRAAQQKAALAPYKERSPWAVSGGEFIGETLATLPAGGLGGAAGKVGINTARSVLTGRALGKEALQRGGLLSAGATLAGEGAAIGAFTAEGKDVLDDAAEGATTGLAVGGTLGIATKAGGAFVRDRFRLRRANREVDGQLKVAEQRVQDAREHGGYALDGATALATQRGHDALAEMGQDAVLGQRLRDHRAAVELQVTGRAVREAETYGPVKAGGVSGQVDSIQLKGQKEKALVPVQRTLAALKLADQRKWQQLYREFDRLAEETSTFLDGRPVGLRIAEARRDVIGSASEGLAKKVDADLARYGITLDGSKPRIGKDSKPLRLEGIEDLVQQLNDHYSPTLNTGEKRYLRAVRDALEGAADAALQELGERAGAGSAVFEAGKRAREARRAFSETWTKGDIIQRLAERTEGGEFAMDYAQSIGALAQGGARDLQRVKAQLLTAKRGSDAWKSLQQSPLLEALYEATRDNREAVMEGGIIKLDAKKFRSTLERLVSTEEAKEVLWGKDGTARVNRMMDSWMDRFRKPDISGASNTSGTADALLKRLRWTPGGLGRDLLQSLPMIGDEMAKGARMEAAGSVLAGNVPDNVRQQLLVDLLADWESRWTGAGGQRYGDMLRMFARTGITVELTDED